jgi:hypothetical protein
VRGSRENEMGYKIIHFYRAGLTRQVFPYCKKDEVLRRGKTTNSTGGFALETLQTGFTGWPID